MACKCLIIFITLCVVNVNIVVSDENAEKPADDESWIQEFLGKSYVKTECDKEFSFVMKEFGLNMFSLKIAKESHPVTKLTSSGQGKYDLVVSCLGRENHLVFQFNKEVEYTTIDGRTVKAIATLDKNVMTIKEDWKTRKSKKEKTATFTREYSDKEVKVTLTTKGTSTVCIFKEVETNKE